MADNDDFAQRLADRLHGRIAVVTGGGTGMGRELCRLLTAAGAHVSTCDVSADAMAETERLCREAAPDGTRVTTFVADVSDEAQMLAFRDHVVAAHGTDCVHLVMNNAGIGGGGSMIADPREDWDRTFGVCWGGVYHGTRAFLPLLVAAPADTSPHLVNTSSVNGLWAALGPEIAHSAYSAAKFAVRGFTEALQIDLRVNAPHVRASVVMPGHIGTSIIFNSGAAHGRDPKSLSAEHVAEIRALVERRGLDTSGASDEDIRNLVVMQAQMFLDAAPMTAAEAAEVILDAVLRGEWRILVGDDARHIDELVRAHPTEAYEPEFFDRVRGAGHFGFAG
jgi:NAD(P)-dependent dehydrogenase (short-subunit alcohol dehydrogenase family)